MQFITRDRVPVLHRSEVKGIVIADTQDVELRDGDKIVCVDRHRFWRDWDTQAIHHIDTINVTDAYL